ncbi:MAG TPA: YdcH family protein [Vicinamibacterales bacterium]|nr:YdcH family protein [Vicinamibacterales bacterium]
MGDFQLSQNDGVKEALLQSSEDFRQLVSEHQALDQQIRQLSSLSFLTDEQQYKEASLKKRKLALKDQIEAILREQRSASRSGS